MKFHTRVTFIVALVLIIGLAGISVALAAVAETNVSNTANDALAPAIAVTSNDAVHIVWEEWGGTDSVIYHSTFGSGSPQPLSYGDSPALVADSSGGVHLAWADWDVFSGNFEIFYSSLPAGGDWSVPADISLTSGTSGLPAIAADPNNNPHFVWVDNSPGFPAIFYSDLASGGPIPNGGGTSPDIAVDKNGTVHVVWHDSGQPTVVYYAKKDSSGWSLPEKLSDNTTANALAPRIALVDTDVYVVWVESGELHATEGASRNWTTPATISGSDTGVQFPAIQADGLGKLHVAWTNAQQTLRYTHRQPAGAWEAPITLDINTAGLAYSTLAADKNGTAHAAWAGKTTSWDVFYQTRPVPTLIGDLDANCIVNVRDVMEVVTKWNNSVTDPTFNFNGDDQIDAGDAAEVASRWHVTCP